MKTLPLALLLLATTVAGAEEPLPEPMLMSERAKIFQRNVKTFRLHFQYHGDEDKPFYRPHLSVPPSAAKIDNPFSPFVQISEAQALKLIAQLERDGALADAYDQRDKARREPPSSPGYTLHIECDELPLCLDLGWGKPLLARLDGLAAQCDGDARKSLDFMLGRISFLRRAMP